MVGAGTRRPGTPHPGPTQHTPASDGLSPHRADAEDLPFDDESFDVVISSIGAMFAPHHQLTANEIVRVCRPGATIGLLSWTRKA